MVTWCKRPAEVADGIQNHTSCFCWTSFLFSAFKSVDHPQSVTASPSGDGSQYLSVTIETTGLSYRFTPDFTTSRVIRELKLVTCGGSEFLFVLNASLPYHMLAACAETLPRPSWELELYVIVSLVMR